MNVDRPDWQQHANCKGIPTNLFFPSNANESAIARAIIKPICDACVVFDECRTYALSFPEKALQGIWANTTDNDRRRYRYSVTPVIYVSRNPTTERPDHE